MRLKIQSGALYVDGMFMSHVENGNGESDLPRGLYDVSVQFSHAHGCDLPMAHGIGWMGFTPERDAIVLGSVRGRHSLLPSRTHVARLQSLVEQCEEDGKQVTLEVM